MVRRGLLILTVLATASAARGQTWPICFEDNGAPTPEAYVAFRDAARSFREAGQYGARARLSGPGADGPAWSEAGVTAYVELLRAGVSPTYLETAVDDDADCFTVTVERVDPARNPPGLWHRRHVYGFAPGSAEIEQPGARAAVRVAAALYEVERTKIRLDGNTDTVGAAGRNMALSRRRAEAVARALVREGVRWEDIEIQAHGEMRLARPTPDETPEPLNRRVQIDMRWLPARTD